MRLGCLVYGLGPGFGVFRVSGSAPEFRSLRCLLFVVCFLSRFEFLLYVVIHLISSNIHLE